MDKRSKKPCPSLAGTLTPSAFATAPLPARHLPPSSTCQLTASPSPPTFFCLSACRHLVCRHAHHQLRHLPSSSAHHRLLPISSTPARRHLLTSARQLAATSSATAPTTSSVIFRRSLPVSSSLAHHHLLTSARQLAATSSATTPSTSSVFSRLPLPVSSPPTYLCPSACRHLVCHHARQLAAASSTSSTTYFRPSSTSFCICLLLSLPFSTATRLIALLR